MRIKCSQCQSEYSWDKAYCPRCAARNERSPALIAWRLLAVVLVVTAIGLTHHLLARQAEFSGSGGKPIPAIDESPTNLIAAPSSAPPQDPKFGNP